MLSGVLDAVGDDVADTAVQAFSGNTTDVVNLTDDTDGGLIGNGSTAVESNRFPEAPEVSPAPLPAALREAMAEIEKLRAENEQLLNWIMGESDALTVLQSIYQSAASSEHTRIKAATGALPFERPKLTASIGVVVDFRERVRQARLKSTARLIEHIPDVPESA